MIDFARITARAGDGGRGSGSFHHIKGKRYGKADGGNGGNGGNVYCEATGDLNTLEKYRYVKDYKAGNGGNGLSNHRRGADWDDLVLLVPVGTVVKIENLKLKIENFFDLVEDRQKVLVARSGEGGRGNSHLRDEFGRRPRVGETGQEGEQVNLTLELKLIADVGLIGLPNAGKSTLLSKLTKAQPKIAAYPFTTLEPNLGVLVVGNPSRTATRKSSLILADIPGLIEGASAGRGLGDLFLRHIERTKVLMHLVDVVNVTKTFETSETFETFDTSGLWQDYQTVRNELRVYSKELAKKKEIIVLTKIDLVDRQIVSDALSFFKRKKKKVLAISAQNGEGLDQLVEEIS